jgi:autotransporter-associated beta strand protein
MPQNIRLGTISENAPGSGIIANGAATLTLAGVNTYTGATRVQSGTMVLAAGASIATSTALTVDPGAVLDTTAVGMLSVSASQLLTVNGTLNGSVELNGTLRGAGRIAGTLTGAGASLISPGNSAGTLTVDILAMAPGAALEMEIGKAVPGAQPVVGIDYDTIVATGAVGAVNSAVQVDGALGLVPGLGIEQNDVFTLIINGTLDPVNGEFDGLPHGSTFAAGALLFQISYADDSATPAFELVGGNDISILAIPEPATATLLLGGLAACALRRPRRNTASAAAA